MSGPFSRALAELERTRANLIQVGTVTEVDYAKARAKVLLAGLETAWLPWTTTRAGGDRTWASQEVSEQVLVVCPDGDPAQGVIAGSIYQAQWSAPAASGDVTRTVYSDGAITEYDRAAHAMAVTLPAGGALTVTAPGGVTITATAGVTVTAPGNVTVTAPTTTLNGNLVVTGSISTGTGAAGGATIRGNIQQISGSFTTDGAVTSAGDQVAGTISQKSHVHTGVVPGGGLSGAPQP
jgi:phage baseplate assembly protein V